MQKDKEHCYKQIEWVGTNKISGLFYWISSIGKYNLVFAEDCKPIAIKTGEDKVYELSYIEDEEEMEEIAYKILSQGKRTGYFMMTLIYFFAFVALWQNIKIYLPDYTAAITHNLVSFILVSLSLPYLIFQSRYEGEYKRYLIVGKYVVLGAIAALGFFSSSVSSAIAVFLILAFAIYDEQISPLDTVVSKAYFFRIDVDEGEYVLMIIFKEE